MAEGDTPNLTTDEKLVLLLARLATLESDIGLLKVTESGRLRLADCDEKDPASSELFIVEGDIPGMTCMRARNQRTQAILPLEGKVLNVEKARYDIMLSSREFNDLISVLGAGIDVDYGDGYFDIEKLRYHKIILLCDRHVEGSRFCDLLLGFFYRYMSRLFDHKTADGEKKSHVYIAKSPYYQVWRGNVGLSERANSTGQYIEDDRDLNRYLIRKATEEITIAVKKTGERIDGQNLISLLEKLLEFNDFYHTLEVRLIDRKLADALLDAMIGGKGLMRTAGRRLRDIFADESLLGGVEAALAEAGFKIRLISDKEKGLSAIEVGDPRLTSLVLIDWELAAAVEFERATDLCKTFLMPVTPPYVVKRGDSETEVKSRGELLDYILHVGMENLAIQRFENLGEMNPQQVWESVLDPEKRALSQVSLEDAARADKLYTTLMGDQAESRTVRSMIDGLSEEMNAVREDIKEIKRDLKDIARGFNTLAGDNAKLRTAQDEIETRVSTLERKS